MMLVNFVKAAVTIVTALVAGMAGAALANDDQTEQGKKAAETLVRVLYAKTTRSVEYPRGQEEARKRCDYLQSVFEEVMLQKSEFGCNARGVGFVRFPGMYTEELSEFDDEGKLPGYRIIASNAKGQAAIVKVQAPIIKGRRPSRVVYYFRETDGRWRISNLLTYDHWPLDTNQEGGCRYVSGYYSFALPPKTEADLEDLPPLCKALELDNMRRSGSSGAQQKAK